MKKTSTKRIAASALLASLSFVIMYMGAISGVLDLCAVTVGALLTAFAVIEMGKAWPWLLCTVCSVLSLLFLPDKFAALEYIVLGGAYPIIKSYVERLPRIMSWGIKLLYFNVSLTACLFAAKFLLNIKEDWVGFGYVVYGLSNLFFVIYDVALTSFITMYLMKWRKRIKIKL